MGGTVPFGHVVVAGDLGRALSANATMRGSFGGNWCLEQNIAYIRKNDAWRTGRATIGGVVELPGRR